MSVIILQLSDIDQSNLNDKVKQIIFKLQKNQSPQLTAIDIERIVKGVISEELSALKADLLHKINDAKGNVVLYTHQCSLYILSIHCSITTRNIYFDSRRQSLQINKKNLRENRKLLCKCSIYVFSNRKVG